MTISNSKRVDLIMAFEGGNISESDLKKLFTNLIDTGMVWKLQGTYGRTAKRMLETGFIKVPTKKSQLKNKLRRKK